MGRANGILFRTLPLLVVLSLHVLAAEGRVRTALEPEEIFLGESVNYQVSVENLPANERPDLKHLEADFKVEFLNSGTEQSMSIVGGSVTKLTRVNHVFRLTPKRAGTLTVTGPTVESGGRNYKGADVTVVVAAPEKQDLVVAEIVTSAANVYPTQEFDVTLRVLLRPLPDSANRDPLSPLQKMPAIQINWVEPPDGLQPLEDMNAWLGKYQSRNEYGFSLNGLTVRGGGIFGGAQLFLSDLLSGTEKRDGLDGTKVEYHVYELKRTFRAEKFGTFRFGPASVTGTFVDGVRNRRYSGRRLVVTTNEAVVDVRDVPANRPATFSGAIGAFDVNASAAPMALRVGDPLTLTLTFNRQKGAGSLDRLGAPDLTANDRLAADFDIVDRNPTGEANGNTKKFSYSLRPKRPGVTIPEITASLFDPVSEKFTDVKTAPIALNVTEASALNAAEIVGTLTPRAGQDLRSADQGLFQNVLAVNEIQNQKAEPVFALVAAGAAWLGALLGCVLISRRRSFAGDVAWQRRDAARRNAERALSAARGAQQPADAARHVRGALLGLIADMRNRPAAGLTAADAAQELKAAGAPGELATKTNALLETLEAVEYAPQSAADMAGHIQTAGALIPELHRALEKTA